jgi:hypothetical protein
MPRKPNYGLQRADVNRAKQAKQEAKQREREEAVAKRRAERESRETGLEPLADDAEPPPRQD